MKTKFHKTDHFIYRQWDRGIEDVIIEKVTRKLNAVSKAKSMFVISSQFLKKAGLKVARKTNLIIFSKGKVLKTLFFVDDLYAYLKSQNGKINTVIL
ncbi:MAG: hypothetical protein U9Q83_11110 [Bacteroidota bacterium]|nr:hypothetical protein [Bacteroidota bacterium]